MLEVQAFGPVTQFRLSHEINGTAVYWVAAYLVDGLLIDAGCRFTCKQLMDALRDYEITQVVNTHWHEDHVGADKLLHETRGVPVYAHADSLPRIAAKQPLYPYQELVWGYPDLFTPLPLGDEVVTPNHRFRVVETPGHSVGHVVLFEPREGWLFSGDIFARIEQKVLRADENAPRLIETLNHLAALPGDSLTLFTSVGKVVDDGRASLRRAAEYLQTLADIIKPRIDEGKTIDEIVELIFGGEHPFAAITDGHYSSANLVRSLAGLA